ncbi:hypothetical protein LTSEMON_2105 [Salmonella enterica subsp. enterica serovar Montevideo str. S5-403]|uniref:Uncharacterized protein n=1 Tax=Salmonella enterica subsp. enterica serovar Montevideo str. S5-403 TaxID=913242 RepID=G5Q2F3_SALMO|nr:hypothetical protein LTSEMON_2105 [Salmonella enterica subsp. enterica serovar Montevideo str. S5-403]
MIAAFINEIKGSLLLGSIDLTPLENLLLTTIFLAIAFIFLSLIGPVIFAHQKIIWRIIINFLCLQG